MSKQRICTICARGGSKGVKGKNLKKILGLPLIAHSILQAQKTELFDYIAVSSDSDAILKIAKKYGAQIIIKRPDHLSNDTSPKIPVIRHCLLESEKQLTSTFDTIIDLDATSPLRSISDIIEATKLLESNHVPNIITATEAKKSPYFNIVEKTEQNQVVLSKKLPQTIFRRQDVPVAFFMNASIYGWTRNSLLENDSLFLKDTHLYLMPEERSIDIDSPLDFEFVNFLAQKRGTLL